MLETNVEEIDRAGACSNVKPLTRPLTAQFRHVMLVQCKKLPRHVKSHSLLPIRFHWVAAE